jgi:hypothetical protein
VDRAQHASRGVDPPGVGAGPDGARARLPVIVVTSAVDPRVVEKIAGHKPFHVMHKPWDIDALDRLVAAAARDRAAA